MKSIAAGLAAMFILAMGLTTSSCTARRIRSASASNELLFPLGTYKHSVKINTVANGDQPSRKFAFDGVVQISLEHIKVVVLSPFGVTLFKLDEERSSGKIELVNFVDALKPHESKIQDYFVVLKLLLTAPQDLTGHPDLYVVHRDAEGRPDEIATQGSLPKIDFVFKKYDQNRIPEQIQIQHPKFSIDIKVTGYEV